MERVTGIGGIFFKASDADKLRAWYRENLGIDAGEDGTAFEWRDVADPEKRGATIWSIFRSETKYLDPSRAPFMVNYRVANLDRMLAQLRAAGATVDEKIEEGEFGRFGWVMDPEGNRLELWEPPAGG